MRTTKLLNIALLAMVVCLGLTSCSKEEDLRLDDFKSGDLYYMVLSNNTLAVIQPHGGEYYTYEISRAIIPHKVKYKGNIYTVTSIGDLAFYNDKNLTYVSIPNSVTSIDIGAFSNCTSLTSIELPNSVTNIDQDAFMECYNLESINIPTGVTHIGSRAFSSCHKLELPDIPGTVEEIVPYTFYHCDYSRLSAINIPDGVKRIYNSAFAAKKDAPSSVTSITIPNSVTDIYGGGAFRGGGAFSGHNNVNTIVLGKGLKVLEDAFDVAPNVDLNVYCLATTPPKGSSGFPYRSNVTVYIPKGSKDSYEAKDSDWIGCNFVELDEEDFPAN